MQIVHNYVKVSAHLEKVALSVARVFVDALTDSFTSIKMSKTFEGFGHMSKSLGQDVNIRPILDSNGNTGCGR